MRQVANGDEFDGVLASGVDAAALSAAYYDTLIQNNISSGWSSDEEL